MVPPVPARPGAQDATAPLRGFPPNLTGKKRKKCEIRAPPVFAQSQISPLVILVFHPPFFPKISMFFCLRFRVMYY